MVPISKSDMRLLNYLSSKPEEQQADSLFHWQTQVRDEKRQEAQVPQEVLWKDGAQQRAWENTCYYKPEVLQSDLHFTHLWSADFVERDEDGSVQEAAEGQIRVKAPGGHQQQEELREERRQAQTEAPPAVCEQTKNPLWLAPTLNTEEESTGPADELRLCGMNTCAQVQHIEVGREVVSGVSSGQMVQIGLVEKLPTIPKQRKESQHVH